MDDFQPLDPKKLAALYAAKGVQIKKFHNLDEMVQYLENQMIIGKVNELHRQQLDFIDEAVLKSDMKEAKQILKHIMEL